MRQRPAAFPAGDEMQKPLRLPEAFRRAEGFAYQGRSADEPPEGGASSAVCGAGCQTADDLSLEDVAGKGTPKACMASSQESLLFPGKCTERFSFAALPPGQEGLVSLQTDFLSVSGTGIRLPLQSVILAQKMVGDNEPFPAGDQTDHPPTQIGFIFDQNAAVAQTGDLQRGRIVVSCPGGTGQGKEAARDTGIRGPDR